MQNKPIVFDLPHSLGAAEARRRMEGAGDKLKDHIPGAADVETRWQGDRMHLMVRAMGQEVSGHIDVHETKVHLELSLPGFLGLMASKIEGLLRRKGTDLLEDKSDKRA